MRKQYLLTIIGAILALALVSTLASAQILCDYGSIQQSWNQTQSPTLALTCTNTGNATVQMSKVGNYFSISPSLPFTYTNPAQQQIFTLTFDPNAPIGNSQGLIYFNDGSSSILINMTVAAQQQQQAQTGCQINPSLISYTQAVQQGAAFAIPKITFSPTGCNGDLVLTSSSVSIQGGVVTTQGQKPVYVNSVVSDGILLNVDTTGLNTQQTYTSYLNINVFNKQFQIPIAITVTAGASPITNFSLANLPACSVTSTTLNLNSTYSLVCTNIQPDVTISPDVDTHYIVGSGLDTSATQVIWYFQPVNFGTTIIKANFKYRDYPVGNPYQQAVQITGTSGNSGGTNLSFLFTPSLAMARNNEQVVIQLIDNKTGSLITNNPQLLINAMPINVTNGYSFSFNFSAETDYNLRGLAAGYQDLVQTIRLLSVPMNISISPSTGDTQTMFNITTSALNASLFINGNKVANPYIGTLQQGVNDIKAIQEGYLDTEQNFTVDLALTAANINPDFKEGVVNIFTLSRNDSWSVFYKSSATATDQAQLLNGTGSQISFTPNKAGIYEIHSSTGAVLGTYEIKKGGLAWYWWLVIAVVVCIVIYVIFKSKSSSDAAVGYGQFGGSVNTG